MTIKVITYKVIAKTNKESGIKREWQKGRMTQRNNDKNGK